MKMKRTASGLYYFGDYTLKQIYIRPTWQPWQIYFKGVIIEGENYPYIRDAKKRVSELIHSKGDCLAHMAERS